LHNAGNVLNGVNISAATVTEMLRSSKLDKMGKAVEMIKSHASDLPTFLTQDEKGKKIPGYLSKITDVLGKEQQALLEEMGSVQRSLQHIQHIVSAQQTFAKGAVLLEKVDIAAIVEEALGLNKLAGGSISVVKAFAKCPKIETDKHLVMQILLNLFNNAAKAVGARGEEARITIRLEQVERDGSGYARIVVADNGMGIAAENLAKIFTYGYSTWDNGHGFGLHGSANAARQLNGELSAASDGPGCGAAFTLDLPRNLQKCTA
jgi:two-component system NtrC family sensor kinase